MTELKKIIPYVDNISDDSPLIICFGHAGSYNGIFRSWVEASEDIKFLPIELPREKGSFDNITEEIVISLSQLLHNKKYCLFGHSMGAAFAFETEYLLERDYGLRAEAVFVCGRHSPDLQKNEFYHSSMNTDRLILEIKRLGGTDEALLNNKDYTDIIIPFVRNDYRIHESYRYCGHKISSPIEVNIGAGDISVSISDTNGWRNMTEAEFTRKLFDGNHFFLYEGLHYYNYLHDKCREIFRLQELV